MDTKRTPMGIENDRREAVGVFIHVEIMPNTPIYGKFLQLPELTF